MSIEGATGRTLKNIDVTFPIGLLTCVTGVSGSGKSTLVCDTLYRGLAKKLGYAVDDVAPHTRLLGADAFAHVLCVDQTPIGRTSRSNPATYTGIFTLIRELFARTTQAMERGYRSGHFSFNAKGGRCEACEGAGVVRVHMLFMPDAYVTCEECSGKRYTRDTLSVLYRGYNLYDVLQMTVREAKIFFANIPLVYRKLDILSQVGLEYMPLGQPASTLSGGEAQRLKLAVELAKQTTAHTLYVLDEPTTGLHFHDIRLLLDVLRALCAAGSTVIVIEHNLDVIQMADWIIDMGPEGGEAGGYVLACGAPLDIVRNPHSVIGPYLKERFCDSVSHQQ